MKLTPLQNDRAAGVLVALAAGDALGAGYEFGPPLPDDTQVTMRGGGPFGFAPAEWTDDTSMAVPLAQAFLEDPTGSTTALDSTVRAWTDWAASAKDVGTQTSAVIGAARRLAAAAGRGEVSAAHFGRTMQRSGSWTRRWRWTTPMPSLCCRRRRPPSSVSAAKAGRYCCTVSGPNPARPPWPPSTAPGWQGYRRCRRWKMSAGPYLAPILIRSSERCCAGCPPGLPAVRTPLHQAAADTTGGGSRCRKVSQHTARLRALINKGSSLSSEGHHRPRGTAMRQSYGDGTSPASRQLPLRIFAVGQHPAEPSPRTPL